MGRNKGFTQGRAKWGISECLLAALKGLLQTTQTPNCKEERKARKESIPDLKKIIIL
jgi:hypothetical protein